MLKKVTLFAGSLAASLVLAGALALAGFAPGGASHAAGQTLADGSANGPNASPQPVVQVDTVYVAAPPAQQTVTVHKVVGGPGPESENAGGGD